MSHVVEVLHNHPLSPFHVFEPGLRLGDVPVKSVVQAYYYLKLKHHRLEAAAEHVLTDPGMIWAPERLQPYAKIQIKSPNVNFDCRKDEIYRAIILHQMTEGNPLYDAFFRVLQGLKDPRHAEFRVYANKPEEVMTSGCRYGAWVSNVPGFNVLANIWTEVTNMIQDKVPIESPLIDEMMSNFKLFHPVIPKTALVVMDSQGRNVTEITNGNLEPIGGGQYGHMLRVLSSSKYNLADYKWIIVSCGFNCIQGNDGYSEAKAKREFLQLKELLVREAAVRDKPAVLFSCAFDHLQFPKNPAHVAWIKKELRATGVVCVTWEKNNPFLVNCQLNKQTFVLDPNTNKVKDNEVHVNRRGFREIWRQWCKEFPELRLMSYNYGSEPRSVRKSAFPVVEGQAPSSDGKTPKNVPNLLVTVDIPGRSPSPGPSSRASNKRRRSPGTSKSPNRYQPTRHRALDPKAKSPTLSRSAVRDSGPRSLVSRPPRHRSPERGFQRREPHRPPHYAHRDRPYRR